MKFLLLSPKNRTVYNFRADLIRELIELGYEVVVTGPDMTDVDRIRALGVRFIETSVEKTGVSIYRDLRYMLGLWRMMRREKPDVTLGYTVKPVTYGAIAAKLAGVKNINSLVTGGGYTFTSKELKARLLGIIVRTLYRIGLGVSDHVIFQNPDDLDEFVAKRLVKRKKCSIVHGSGVNMEHFQPAPYPEQVTFFMLSRLLKSKGVVEYLKAAEIIKREHPEARFLLLGKYEQSMQDAIPQELVERYIDSGVVERFEETEDVRPFYEMCSVYVLPSYREGTPRTSLEAMAMARPIITTDTNGCRGTVKDGLNGYMVPVADVDELAAAMRRFIVWPELIERMGQESLAMCRRRFEVGKVNQRMLEIMKIMQTE